MQPEHEGQNQRGDGSAARRSVWQRVSGGQGWPRIVANAVATQSPTRESRLGQTRVMNFAFLGGVGPRAKPMRARTMRLSGQVDDTSTLAPRDANVGAWGATRSPGLAAALDKPRPEIRGSAE